MILVTGATGLVGSHLLYFLTQKYSVVKAIYRSKSKLEIVKKVFGYYGEHSIELFHKIQWVKADVTDVSALNKAFENVTYVYHAAALISFDTKDYLQMRKINIEGTANVVNLCIVNNVKKLCFVSSIASLGKVLKGKTIDENCEWDSERNNSTYAITKYGAEMEVWRGTQEGVPAIIINPGVILGGGFWNTGTGKIFDKIYSGLLFYTKGITGFIGVEDVAKAMIKLMDSNIENERFVVVSENKSYEEVFTKIANCFNVQKPAVKIRPWMSAILWRIDFLRSCFFRTSPLITRSTAKSMHNKRTYSSEKIQKRFNIKFTPIDYVIESVCKQYLNDKKG